jgi:hypothetical protein
VLVPVLIATGYSLVFVATMMHVCCAVIGPIHPHVSTKAQSKPEMAQTIKSDDGRAEIDWE